MQNPAPRARSTGATPQTTNPARPQQPVRHAAGTQTAAPHQPDGAKASALAQNLVAGAMRKRPQVEDPPPKPAAPAKAARVAPARQVPIVETGAQRQRLRGETRAQLLERLTNPLISLNEASIILRVCPATVRRYSNAGLLSHVRTTGGQRRFYFKDVLLLSRQEDARRRRQPT